MNKYSCILVSALLCYSYHLSFGQCQFSVTHNNSNDQCLYATEEVVWSKTGLTAGLTVSGNNLTKSSGTTAFNAGAISVNTVKNNGWASTTILETDKMRAFGLSDVDAGSGLTIDYYFLIRADASVDVYEGASYKKNFPCVTGKTLKLAVENNVVKFYYDGQLKWTGVSVPTLPMVVDASLYDIGSTLRSVEVSNGSDGSFTASAPVGDMGTSPTYLWYLNGSPTGITTSTYTNASLTSGDFVHCVLAQTGGCSASATSNTVRFQIQPASIIGNYYATTIASPTACIEAREEVQVFSKTNVSSSGNDLTNIGLGGSFSAGASSSIAIYNNGYAETTVAETNKTRVFGLSVTDASTSLGSVNYAIQIRGDGFFDIWESNNFRNVSGTYSTGQVFKIAIENGEVKYYVGGTLRYTSSVLPPSLPLVLDLSFFDAGATLNDIIVSNRSNGVFAAVASVTGSSPAYQWKDDLSNVGINSSSYTATSLLSGHQITCVINPDRIGCTTITTPITLSYAGFAGTFSISNVGSTYTCKEAKEALLAVDKVNVNASSNNITKFLGNDGFWDSGATSANQINDNGYAETTILETNTDRMFGLSSSSRALTHTSYDNTKIQYGITFYSNGTFRIFESNVDQNYNGGTYATGDVFKIKVDFGVVRYYKGATNIYSSVTAPTLPLVVDMSFRFANATLTNINIYNESMGQFNATAVGAGPLHSYQWNKNTIPIAGATSSSYSTSLLTVGDAVDCTLLPNILGCPSINSNVITLNIIGDATSPTTTWNGSSTTAWENSANWSNGRPRGYLKAIIPSGTPRSPIISSDVAVFDLTIQSGATLAVSGNRTVNIYNKWDNLGVFTAGTSTVTLKNCTSNQNTLKVSASGNIFNDLVVNNANGVMMDGTHSVSHDLNLTAGIVSSVAPADMMVILNGATVTGGSTTSHINGKVKKVGNSAFTFPVGKSGIFRPISITAPALITDEFVAEYFHTKSLLGGTVPASIYTKSGCEYWDLIRAAGSSAPRVTLNWINSECDETSGAYVTDASELVVLGHDGTNWKDRGNTGFSGTTSGWITSGATISSYGTFTLGSYILGNTLPIEFLFFSAEKSKNGVQLNWRTASETDNESFIVEKMEEVDYFKSIGSIEAKGYSDGADYEYLDRNPSKGVNYYRLKQVDVDGSFTYSTVISVEFDSNIKLSAFPNPVNRGQNLEVVCTCNKFSIIDTVSGEVLQSFENEFFIKSVELTAGVYILVDGKLNKSKLVVR